MPAGLRVNPWTDLEVAGPFRLFSVRRKIAMSRKTCPVWKRKRNKGVGRKEFQPDIEKLWGGMVLAVPISA